jgi:hypothetical protein
VYALSFASFQEHNQDDPFINITTTENRYTLPYVVIFSLITSPLLTKDILLLFKSSKDTYKRGHRRTC